MRWAYIIDDDKNIYLSERGCHFLEAEVTSIETKTTEQEIAGRDGVLVGANTFGSFELSLNFYYDGTDSNDLKLFVEKLKKIIHSRKTMYVVHSDMPGRKYAFNSAKVEWENITNSDTTFTITFNCYKGYSESLLNTMQMNLSNDYKWQFENGHLSDSEIKYQHTNTNFSIYNGSDDMIDPSLGYWIVIKINIDAPNGFKLINNTTGDTFEYKKAIKKNKQLVIDGVHPVMSNKRVGIDTNWQWIRLDTGYNDIEITGKGINNPRIEFLFNFVYR